MKPQISAMVMGIYVTTLTKFLGPFVGGQPPILCYQKGLGCLWLAITDQTQQNLGTIYVSTSQSLSIDISPFLLLPWTGRSPDPSFLWCILFVFDCIATLYSLYSFCMKSLWVWHLGTKNLKPIKSPNNAWTCNPRSYWSVTPILLIA